MKIAKAKFKESVLCGTVLTTAEAAKYEMEYGQGILTLTSKVSPSVVTLVPSSNISWMVPLLTETAKAPIKK